MFRKAIAATFAGLVLLGPGGGLPTANAGFASAYTNLTVSGSLNTNLIQIADYQWQGIGVATACHILLIRNHDKGRIIYLVVTTFLYCSFLYSEFKLRRCQKGETKFIN